MSVPSPPPASSSSDTGRAANSLRLWGVVLLVLFLLTSTVGGSLSLESSYLAVTLASHIGLALVTVGASGYATSFVGRKYRAVPRSFAGLAALAALGATVAGTVFLLAGQSNGALYAMEGLAGLGVLASLVLIAVGGPSGQRLPAGDSP